MNSKQQVGKARYNYYSLLAPPFCLGPAERRCCLDRRPCPITDPSMPSLMPYKQTGVFIASKGKVNRPNRLDISLNTITITITITIRTVKANMASLAAPVEDASNSTYSAFPSSLKQPVPAQQQRSKPHYLGSRVTKMSWGSWS